MLLASLFTSLQSVLESNNVQAQQISAPVVQEATILDTSPRSFQDSVPLGEIQSYTLSLTDEASDVVVGTATLVEGEADATNLYLEMNVPYTQAALYFGTCEEPQVETFVFESPVDDQEPMVISESMEELLHPRLDYLLQVETESNSYCVEL